MPIDSSPGNNRVVVPQELRGDLVGSETLEPYSDGFTGYKQVTLEGDCIWPHLCSL